MSYAVLRATVNEDRFKHLLVPRAALQPNYRVLVTGFDGDAKVLDLARAKDESAGVDIALAQGLASQAPFPPASFAIQLLDGFATTTDNVRGLLPTYLPEAGFRGVEEAHREKTVFGTLSLYRGVAP